MTFRKFLKLFNRCDHCWGALARYADESETWKGDNALSLSILLQSDESLMACYEVNVVYCIYQKPIGLDLDSNEQLAQRPNPIKAVINDGCDHLYSVG